MKKKKILVVYFGNGDLKNIALKEMLINKLTKEIEDSGIPIKMKSQNKTVFSDGSSIESNPFCLRGVGYTHVYMQDNVADKLSTFANSVLVMNNLDKYDVRGDRLFSYSGDNGELNIEPLD